MKKIQKLFILFSVICLTFLYSRLAAQSKFNTAENRKKIETRTLELGDKLARICDKSLDFEDRYLIMNETLQLFDSPDTQEVEVSSTNKKTKKTYTLRSYLNHLLDLKYKSITINWKVINESDDIREETPERLTTGIRIVQHFIGIGGNKTISYEDITIKNIQIIIPKLLLLKDSKNIEKEQIKFGNMLVESTSVVSKS